MAMHKLALLGVIESVMRRASQGDCPTEPPQPREILEEAIIDMASGPLTLKFSNDWLREKIATDPDDEPMAGGFPPSDQWSDEELKRG